MTVQELAPFVNLIGTVISLLRSEARYAEQDARLDEQQLRDALQSINLALTESRKYLAAPEGHNNKQRQLEISRLWKDSSIKFRKVSGEMVSVTAEKAKLWADDLKWPKKIVIAKGIDLTSIQIEFNRLILQSSDTE